MKRASRAIGKVQQARHLSVAGGPAHDWDASADSLASENRVADVEKKAVETNVASTEKTRDELLTEIAKLLSGTTSVNLASLLLQQVQAVQSQTHVCKPEDATRAATAGLTAVKPGNYIEGMLAAQMIQTNYAVAEFMRRATHPEQMADAVDRNVNRAVRLGRLFVEQIEALQKLRGQSGQQRVIVEHVTVEAGAQAIVGAVAPGGGDGET